MYRPHNVRFVLTTSVAILQAINATGGRSRAPRSSRARGKKTAVDNHKNNNFLNYDWFKKLLFSTARSISQSHSKLYGEEVSKETEVLRQWGVSQDNLVYQLDWEIREVPLFACFSPAGSLATNVFSRVVIARRTKSKRGQRGTTRSLYIINTYIHK